jgi:hypothetical protein
MSAISHAEVKTSAHRRFLMGAVRARAGRFPYAHWQPGQLEAMVRKEIVQGATARVIHVEEEPDVFLGCFVVRPGTIIFAYTKENLQQQGLMSAALAQYGITFEAPTPVLVWSAAASRIAAKGYPIYPQIPGGMQ